MFQFENLRVVSQLLVGNVSGAQRNNSYWRNNGCQDN